MFLVGCILLAFCGIGSSEPIVYGARFTKVEYPFVVHLNFETSETDSSTGSNIVSYFGCGGSLISLRTVLTAAHCLEDSISEPEVTIYSGVILRKYFGKRGQTRNMLNYAIHSDYILKNIDIAVVHVVRAFIQEPGSTEPGALTRVKYADMVTIVGWGEREYSKKSDVLRRATMKVVDREDCEPSKGSQDVFICMRNGLKRSTFCDGDSGGPVIFNGKIVGVQSESIEDIGEDEGGRKATVCIGTEPSMAVDISKYSSWIQQNRRT